MFRKRRQPTPGFKIPPPYEPLEGIRAPLKTEGVFPYCAMYQVAEEDTETDYVLCRGFDVRINKFIDYEKDNPDKPGIAVAKPFGSRGSGKYKIGQIFPACLPLQTTNPSPADVDWRVGQNPGVAETTTGHPADLDEAVEELSTDEGKFINWMFIDGPAAAEYIEITYIDDDSRSFEMATYGVCIGKIITYDESANWATQYPGYVIEDAGDEVFIGFVSQDRAGVPGQRYYGVKQGTKTCGDLTLPFVLVDGGAPTMAVLAEDHPGCGTVFDVWLGPAWNTTSHEWDFDQCDGSTKYKAIDLRVWGLDPLKYATGLFVARVSLTHGIILEVIELDCTSPGSCQFCEE